MTSAPWWIEWTDGSIQRRAPISGTLWIGRGDSVEVRVADPYVSRRHCSIAVVDGVPVVDASESLNRIRVAGEDYASVVLKAGDAFMLGETTFRISHGMPHESTLKLPSAHGNLLLRRSTRELLDREGTLVAQFSSAEFSAFEAAARRHPDAASHAEVARAVWGDMGYDQYQIHRLMQRIRQRLGTLDDLLENVRGAGYRIREPVDVV